MAPPDVAFPNPAGRPLRPYPSDLAILLTKYFKPYQISLTLNYLIIDLTQFCTYVLCPSILTFPATGIFIVLRLCQRLILVIPSPSLCHTWKESIFLFSSIFQLCQLCFHVDSFINFSSKWNIKGCQTEIYCREIVFLLLNGKLLERKGWFLTILFSSYNRIFSIF